MSKSVSKSIRITPQVNDFINSFPGNGFNEKLEEMVLFFMVSEDEVKDRFERLERNERAANDRLMAKRSSFNKIDTLARQIDALAEALEDVCKLPICVDVKKGSLNNEI